MKLIHKTGQIMVLDERFYTKNGKIFYPGATNVLSCYPKGKGFEEFLKNTGQNVSAVLEKAGNEGSNVHEAIEAILKGKEVSWADEEGKPVYNLTEWRCIVKFMQFYGVHKPEIVAVEEVIISDKYKLGTMLDFVCRINGELWYIDHKTSKNIFDNHYIQLAMSVELWNECHEEKITRSGVLWLKAATRGPDKKGVKMQGAGWQVKESPRGMAYDWETYLAVRKIWDRENPNFKPKNLIYPDKFSI